MKQHHYLMMAGILVLGYFVGRMTAPQMAEKK